ncbi:hypothetical protein GGR21_000385 [Dysgonomonas hofstadii]|uniref:Uncharacterized protein n=1 Tax=Dysgonomonas hofstadii TaxID=637886 RepID=A0A840CEW7_9BACT|nr:hypothetical protein [Dysgonomonas hofstadii]
MPFFTPCILANHFSHQIRYVIYVAGEGYAIFTKVIKIQQLQI